MPPPGTAESPAVSGAAPAYLALSNNSAASESYTALASGPSGSHVLATGTLAAGATVEVDGSPLAVAGFDPIIVRASGPLGVSEDTAPSSGFGVVTMPGIPLAATIGVVNPLQVVALVAPPRGAPAQQHDAGEQQGEEQRSGDADDALDVADEPADTRVPGPHHAGPGNRVRPRRR